MNQLTTTSVWQLSGRIQAVDATLLIWSVDGSLAVEVCYASFLGFGRCGCLGHGCGGAVWC
ncbi:hypothetical protein, partial [Nocardia brasiliensis]|uniref:hypothetical protein n=1 Tax=Nocardia brasiliensis TaxID=37326 RepID=UPI0024587ABA